MKRYLVDSATLANDCYKLCRIRMAPEDLDVVGAKNRSWISMSDQWQVVHNEPAHRFEVALGGEIAKLDYHLRNSTMVVTHTGVPRAWEGQGIAASLTRAALDYARDRGLSVLPLCSYVTAYIRRHPQYRDLTAG